MQRGKVERLRRMIDKKRKYLRVGRKLIVVKIWARLRWMWREKGLRIRNYKVE
jgi:hypothetical protein